MDKQTRLGNQLIVAVFCFYVVSQAEIAKAYSSINTIITSGLMLASTCLFLISKNGELQKILRGWRWLGVFVSVLILYTPNVELEASATVLTKFAFLLTCSAILFSGDPYKTFDKAAIMTVCIVVAVSVLALSGVIPSALFSADDVTKYTAGFNNPNTPMYFLYCSYAYFFLRGKALQLSICFGAGVFMAMIGALSKTYAAGILLLTLLYFLPRYTTERRLINTAFTLFAFTAMILGVSFYTLVIWAPETVSWLAYSPLDLASSLRLSAAIEYLFTHGNTLSGFKFRGQDSMFFEAYIMLGPIYLGLFASGLATAFAGANISPAAFRLAKLLTVACVTGLTQALILNLTPFSVTVFSMAFMTSSVHLRRFRSERHLSLREI